MGDVIDRDGFRANVGIVLMDDAGQLFLGRRSGGRGWQFPQGGVRRGETPEEALYRELHEEIGLTADDVQLVGQTSNWLRYRLPRRFVRRDSLPLCIGQKQRWFLLRLARPDAQFRFDTTGSPEFDRWRWVDYWQPVREVIYFKRPVYVRALQELAEILNPGAPPPYPAWWGRAAAPRRPRRRAKGAASGARRGSKAEA
jgi:putative (di)nucleoside polyphosphate hydrolase